MIADCPKEKKKNKYNKVEDKKNKGKKRGEAHLGEEWESNDSDSSDNVKKKKGAANIAIHSLFITNHDLPRLGFTTKTLP